MPLRAIFSKWAAAAVPSSALRSPRPPATITTASRRPYAAWVDATVRFGSQGELYAEKRGPGVEELIQRIDKAAREYPYANTYTLWPGPNSNTFTAWVARAVPELEVDLPATAIGKDYIGASMVSTAPSGRGFQFSLRGLLGVSASGIDGFEVNLLSLNFGVSPTGIKLPLIGRIGVPRFAAEVPAQQPAN